MMVLAPKPGFFQCLAALQTGAAWPQLVLRLVRSHGLRGGRGPGEPNAGIGGPRKVRYQDTRVPHASRLAQLELSAQPYSSREDKFIPSDLGSVMSTVAAEAGKEGTSFNLGVGLLPDQQPPPWQDSQGPPPNNSRLSWVTWEAQAGKGL